MTIYSFLVFDIAGVFTAEGNVAGGRAGRLAAKRLKEQEEYAKQRQKLADKHAKGSVKSISSKFTKTSNKKELVFKVCQMHAYHNHADRPNKNCFACLYKQ